MVRRGGWEGRLGGRIEEGERALEGGRAIMLKERRSGVCRKEETLDSKDINSSQIYSLGPYYSKRTRVESHPVSFTILAPGTHV